MISDEISSFLIDRRTRHNSTNTINFYTQELAIFRAWCQDHLVTAIEELTPDLLRLFLLDLGDRRTAGGLHSMWRVIKAFLRWWEAETEPADWKSPLLKVTPPKISTEPLPGLAPADFQAMLATCGKDYYGIRNRAILIFLLDTGVRVSELCAVNLGDVDQNDGSVVIRSGKGGKRRLVFMGSVCRREVNRYLRRRLNIKPTEPLFSHKDGGRFNRKGIEMVIRKVAAEAGLDDIPSPHDFRRAFTKASLKNTNVVMVARMLGHSGISLVSRYTERDDDDLREAHDKSSPVDNL